MGHFPVRSTSENQYVIPIYHAGLNAVIVENFQLCHDRHRLATFYRIMARLQQKGHGVNLQIMDNDAREAYKLLINEKWRHTFQLVPPSMQRHNAAEQAIRTSTV